MDVHNSDSHSPTYSDFVNTAETPSSSDSTCTTMYDSGWRKQVLPTSWVDRKRLLQILRHRFGDNNFRVQVSQLKVASQSLNAYTQQLRLNKWTVFAPDTLNEVRYSHRS